MSAKGWSNEIAVGVAVIDADHRHLLSLVERAEVAQGEGDLRTAVRLLRLFLGDFNRHFEKEQQLLAGQDGAVLALRRSEFLTSQAVVETHPLEADDVERVGQACAFVRAWLMDHVVRQDMPLRTQFLDQAGGAGGTRRRGRRFDLVKLRWRIALLAAVPLAALVVLASIVAGQLRQQAESMEMLRQMNAMNGEVGRLVHELQRERGLAALYIADRQDGPGRFQAQIKRTDDAHGRFDLAAAALSVKLSPGPAQQVLDNAITALDIIPEIRDDVQSGGFDGLESIDIYTTAIEDLNAVVPEVVRALLPSDFATNTLSYMFLLEAKERAGRERAAGVAMLGREARGGRPHKSLQELAAEEQAYIDGFLELAPPDLARSFREAAAAGGPSYQGFLSRLESGETDGITAREWFEVASRRFDAMNEVQSQLIERLAADAALLQQAAWRKAAWLGGGLGALVLLSLILVAVLGWTILPPLRRIGVVIQRLARGERAVAVPWLEAGDELGDIARSVQSLKERLVHGDLLAARRGTENAERLRAVTDNVPGVVFRIHQGGGRAAVVACVSRKLQEITGLRADQVMDLPVRSLLRRLLRREDWPVVLLALHRAGAQPLDFEFRLRAVAGKTRWLRVLASPTRTDNGLVWDGVALDVSGLKRAEEEQARMNAELGRVYRAQATSQLGRGIGRELAALVEPLVAQAEQAAASLAFSDPARERVLAVIAAAGKIRALGQRVADLGASGDGGRELVDMVAIIADRVAAMRELLPSLVVEARLEAAGTLVLSSRDEIEKLFAHLCAYVADGERGRGGVLTVATALADDQGATGLALRVGLVGASDQSHRHGRCVVRSDGPASGFALAMARAAVEACGGNLGISHTEEGGISVEVVVPIPVSPVSNVVKFQGGPSWQSSRP